MMILRTQLYTLGLLFTASIVHAQKDARVTWYYPTGGQNYFLSDILNASYSTPYPEPRLGLWCIKMNDTGGHIKIIEQNGSPGNGWTLVHLDKISFPPSTCWFIIWEKMPNGEEFENHDDGHGQAGNRFNVQFSKQAVVTVGLSPPTTSAAPSPSLSSPNTSSSSGNPTQQPQPNSPQTAGLSTGAIAGVAVGAAILSFVLGGLAVVYWRRRRSQVAEKSHTGSEGFNGQHGDSHLPVDRDKNHAGYPPRELSDTGSYQPHELSG